MPARRKKTARKINPRLFFLTRTVARQLRLYTNSIRKQLKSLKFNYPRPSLKKIPFLSVRTKFLGLVLIILGGILIAFPKTYQTRIGGQISPIKTLVSAAKSAENSGPIKIDPKLLSTIEPSQVPSRVVVPKLSLDLPIVEAKVVNGLWELSETSASHGIGSANPGENGNIVVFAHARDGLFGPLRNVKKDEEIYLLTKDHWFKYKIVDIKEVTPDQTEVIAPTSKETLTLYTCTGFLDGKRLVVVAKPF